MEKMDMAIAVAGGVILVVAIVGSAVYGGAGVEGGSAFAVTFPTMDEELSPSSASPSGGGASGEFTFDVTQANLTELVFTGSTGNAAGGVGAPAVTVTVRSPTDETFGGDSAEVTVPLATPPAPFSASAADADAVTLPPANASGTGAWIVTVTATTTGPPVVPFSLNAAATVTYYVANVAPVPDATGAR